MTSFSNALKLASALVVAAAFLFGCRGEKKKEESIEAVERETQAVDETADSALMSEPEPVAQKLAPPPSDQPDPRATYYVPLLGDEPQKGPDDALFTIVAFSDYQCPFCKNMEPVLEELRAKYADDLRVVWMQFPLPRHSNARAAATAALEAQAQKGDKGYWQMHDKLFANQHSLRRPDLERYAKELGLDLRKFRRALDTDKHADVIERHISLGTRLGFRGTPAFYMNGRFIPGLPLPAWESAIEVRGPIYRRMVQTGVPRAQLYEVLIADGKKTL
jgi:protein-disulfide isomerase